MSSGYDFRAIGAIPALEEELELSSAPTSSNGVAGMTT
jgi:hypothetical protein